MVDGAGASWEVLAEGFGCPLDARFAHGAELALVLRAGKRSGAASRRPFERTQTALCFAL